MNVRVFFIYGAYKTEKPCPSTVEEEKDAPKDEVSVPGLNLVTSNAFEAYVAKNGHHFTPSLADHVSRSMLNADGTTHTWTTREVDGTLDALGLKIPSNTTLGDITYLANQAYSVLYPSVLPDASLCVKAAIAAGTDVNSYDGFAFYRWLADAMSKDLVVDWSRYM